MVAVPVPEGGKTSSHGRSSVAFHAQPAGAVILSVPLRPSISTGLATCETPVTHVAGGGAWIMVAVAEGPPVSPVSRKVILALRWAVVVFAAKLTVTT